MSNSVTVFSASEAENTVTNNKRGRHGIPNMMKYPNCCENIGQQELQQTVRGVILEEWERKLIAFNAAVQSEEASARIIAAVQQRCGEQLRCSLCGGRNWVLGKYVTPTVTKMPGVIQFGPETLPCVSLLCTNCGDVHLLSLLVLGFTPEDFASLKLEG